MTKGAYFHHFKSKEALGVAVARYWDETTGDMFQNATYHKLEDPLDRVLGYLDLREELIDGDLAEFTCLVGTMTQEAYQSHKPILDACASCIFDHAQTLEEDIQKAIQIYGVDTDSWNAQSLAQYTQAALQGGFILAKAAGNAEPARESVRHLRRYIELLFNRPSSN
nr:TetR/AcrR family transcriptional regulator [Sneathiella glossodoripedis]